MADMETPDVVDPVDTVETFQKANSTTNTNDSLVIHLGNPDNIHIYV
jgi:hypothetical protein